jgi:hypothetical protein
VLIVGEVGEAGRTEDTLIAGVFGEHGAMADARDATLACSKGRCCYGRLQQLAPRHETFDSGERIRCGSVCRFVPVATCFVAQADGCVPATTSRKPNHRESAARGTEQARVLPGGRDDMCHILTFAAFGSTDSECACVCASMYVQAAVVAAATGTRQRRKARILRCQ